MALATVERNGGQHGEQVDEVRVGLFQQPGQHCRSVLGNLPCDGFNLRVHRCPGRTVLDVSVRVRQLVMRGPHRDIERISGAAAPTPVEVAQHLLDEQAKCQVGPHHDFGLQGDHALGLEPVHQRLRMYWSGLDRWQVHTRRGVALPCLAAHDVCHGLAFVLADQATGNRQSAG
ncbi:hypothetical protein G6F68_013461 [Rhizopus microsporus]|nr:hypothetical protein G6F68_013461 [Rhizopus microsporus]